MSASAILSPADLWHTGIVVDDLEAAKAGLGRELGLTWSDGGTDVRLRTDEGTTTVRTAYALSIEGPHHVELVQSVEGTVWTAIAPGHAHHLGYWVDDVAATAGALTAQGAVHLATIAMSDDAPPMCAYHRTTSGLHVEIVDRRLRTVLLPQEVRA